jgi:hypothetical protein
MVRMHATVVAMVVTLLWAGLAGQAQAKGKKAAAKPAAEAKTLNACGCYRNAAGECFCGRRGKCDCPGDCEPKGCEEKRAKQMQKEIAAETKKAAESDRMERQNEGKKPAEGADEPQAKPKTKKADKDGVGQ